MHLHIVTGRDVTVSMVNDARLLAEDAYPSEFNGDDSDFWGRYYANSETYTILLDREKVIGYLDVMPLKEEAYMNLRVGDMYDCELKPDDLEGENGKYEYAYAYSMVVADEHRAKGYGKLLSQAYITQMKRRFPDGKTLKMLGDTVSDGGRAIAGLLGLKSLKETSHGTKLYEGVIKI